VGQEPELVAAGKSVCFINGKFVPSNEATVSIYDRLFLYGDGIFEGIHVYNGKLFRLEEHLDRLYNSSRYLKIKIPMSREELKEAIRETVRVNKLEAATLRVDVTRGVGAPVENISNAGPPSVIIAVGLPGGGAPLNKVQAARAIIVSTRKMPPECADPRAKSTGIYLNMCLASLERVAAGADAAIMLDMLGFVAEGPGYNVFAIKNDILYTPKGRNILEGITRKTAMEIARKGEYSVQEVDLTPYDLYTADEVFLCSTAIEIKPVIEIDGRVIGAGKIGSITAYIQTGFRDTVLKECQ
jgi:branched-chain amino acid aminotransferase